MVSLRQIFEHVQVLVLKTSHTYRHEETEALITSEKRPARHGTAPNETRPVLTRIFWSVPNRSRQVVLIVYNLTVLSYAY